MKAFLRDVGWGIVAASPFIIAAITLGLSPDASAQPYGCVPTYNTVCTGPYSSCNVNIQGCSTVPGEPGTWNPRGYTPCTYDKGCG